LHTGIHCFMNVGKKCLTLWTIDKQGWDLKPEDQRGLAKMTQLTSLTLAHSQNNGEWWVAKCVGMFNGQVETLCAPSTRR